MRLKRKGSSRVSLAVLLSSIACFVCLFSFGFYRQYNLISKESGNAVEIALAASPHSDVYHGDKEDQREAGFAKTSPAEVGEEKERQEESSKQRFSRQLEALIGKQQDLVFTGQRLKQRTPFSCGGTKTVKLNSLREIGKNHPGLESLLSPTDPFVASSLSSCAVVGNSGSLLESQFGEEIDKHEAVIRFNAAVTQDYEQFVGRKTSFRIFNRPVSRERYAASNETTLTMLRDNGDIRSWSRAVKDQMPSSRDATFFFDPEFLCHSWKFVRKRGEKPSSGLVGIVFALHVCQKGKIDVYGFNSTNYFSESTRPHYYDWERPQKGREKVHPFAQESKFYTALHEHGYLRLH